MIDAAPATAAYGGRRSDRVVFASVFAALVVALAMLAAAPADASTTFAWGENKLDQLGTSAIGQSDTPLTVNGLTKVTAVSAGGRQSLALLSGGTVEAWGDGGNGELGNGKHEKKTATPVAVSGLTEVSAISAGHKSSLALMKNGTVWSWGGNEYGKLGVGRPNSNESSDVPLQVKGITEATAISAGFYYALALLKNGTVMAWGNGLYGNFGNGTTNSSDEPVPVTGLTNVVAIGAGEIDSIALLSNGTVVSFGGNEYGQLGLGKGNKRTDTPQPVEGLSEVVAISAGAFFNLALLKNGTVMAWGYNHSGQLGNGTANTGVNGVPGPVSGLSEVVAISASVGSQNRARTSEHSMALLRNGTVMAWGGNEFGQLGVGNAETALTPQPVVGLGEIVGISAGGFHSLAVS